MADLIFGDSAYPLTAYPRTDGWAFYIGGDTPHTWTAAEVHAIPARFLLPIFVRSNPPGPGAAADVSVAMGQLRAIGAPKGCLVAWDMETAQDAAYIRQVYDDSRGGCDLMVYGSQSSVFGNQNPDGLYWGADWTGRAGRQPGDVVTQWASYNSWDESSGLASLPYWDTRSGPKPPPSNWTETMIANLPVVTTGATGNLVGTVQGCLCARGFPVTIDEVFGPATYAALRAFQARHGLTVDGAAGQHTWPVLITG